MTKRERQYHRYRKLFKKLNSLPLILANRRNVIHVRETSDHALDALRYALYAQGLIRFEPGYRNGEMFEISLVPTKIEPEYINFAEPNE